nr:GNAT family N-acetyltransferase [Mesorhizobium sp. BR1-1-16]
MDGDRPGRRILIFPDLPLDGVAAQALRRHAESSGRPVRVFGTHHRAVLRPALLAGGVRAALSAKTRKELGRQLRRLGDLGPLAFSATTGGPDLQPMLEAFLALEQSGWKGARGTALAMKSEALAFVRAVASAAEPGEMRIDSLAVGDRPAAMLASFRSGGTLVTWKIAHDESLGRFSPGVQVMLEASGAFAADPSLRLVDSLASADHPMIDRLWPDRQAIGTLTIGPRGGGAAFALGVLLAETELRARSELRALIRRS